MEGPNVSRRKFLKTAAAIGATGVVAAGLGACAAPGEGVGSASADEKPWLPTEWADEADIICVGIGAVGLGAAIEGKDQGLGDILILDAAPEEEAGGNSRVCGQLLFIPHTVEGAVTYQTALNGSYVVDPELMQAWAEELCKNKEWLEGLDIAIEETKMASPEYPSVPGADQIQDYLPKGSFGQAIIWSQLLMCAEDRDARIKYDTRIVKLIQDPLSKEVLGVTAEDGSNYKARKGVILGTGGFENNMEMLNQFYRGTASTVLFLGTPYNRGDGIKMLMAAGAELWNMNNYAGIGLSMRMSPDPEERYSGFIGFNTHDYILVGPDGRRFCYEERMMHTRHGYVSIGGGFDLVHSPCNTYAIFGQQSIEGGLSTNTLATCGWKSLIDSEPPSSDPKDYIDSGIIVSGNTAEELAAKIGVDPQGLAETLASYATFVANNQDLDFGKGRPIIDTDEPVEGFDLAPIDPPYYAVEMCPTLLNTQGGPRRGVHGEVLDTEGEPIPRLYAGGELAPVYQYMYNGGGNFSDAMSSGRTAVHHAGALTPWEA